MPVMGTKFWDGEQLIVKSVGGVTDLTQILYWNFYL